MADEHTTHKLKEVILDEFGNHLIPYDEVGDVITIEGVKYGGELFRELGRSGVAFGNIFQVKQDNGTVTLRSISNEFAIKSCLGIICISIYKVVALFNSSELELKPLDTSLIPKIKGLVTP